MPETSERSALEVLRATPASDGGEREPTEAELADVCLSYRHDYGLLRYDQQVRLQSEAQRWLQAWRKGNPALLSGSGTPPGEGEDEWEPMSMAMAGVAHPRLIPFRHRLSGVVVWVDQRAAARLRGEGGGG